MDELQTGIELTLAVFPQAAAFLQPSERALDDPALGHDSKGVQLTTLGNLNVGAKQFLNGLGKWLSHIAAVGQDASNRLQICRTATQGQKGALAVGHIGRGDGNGVRQALRIDRYMALDARNLFARVVALLARTICVLHALRVDDQKARRGLAPLFCTSRANHIFLKPAPER